MSSSAQITFAGRYGALVGAASFATSVNTGCVCSWCSVLWASATREVAASPLLWAWAVRAQSLVGERGRALGSPGRVRALARSAQSATAAED